MKPIRKEYPPIRSYVKKGKTYYRVDLRRKHHIGQKSRNFKTVKEAKDFAAVIATKVHDNGILSIAPAEIDKRIITWEKQFAVYGITLEQGLALALKNCANEKSRKETPFVSELLNLWKDDRINDTLSTLRPTSLAELKKHCNTFKEDWSDKRIGDIDRKFLEDYLQNKKTSNRSKINARSYMSQFFNWCNKNNHTNFAILPTKYIAIKTIAKEPEFYSVEQSKEIMRLVKAESIMPYYALCLFAGIRPYEARRMTWGNINMETNEITLPATITKTKKSRLFTMEDTLIKWLEVANKSLPLIPANLRKLEDKALKDLSFPWIQDGLRHTFCSYYYAKYTDNGLNKLAHIMGNSATIIEKFYKGIISKTKFDGFWSITPDSV